MKRTFFQMLIVGVMIVLCADVATAQEVTIPKSDFSIYTPDSVVIEKGSAHKIDVWALRSKQFAKRKIWMRIVSATPAGLDINFEPGVGYFDYCQATISASLFVQPGTYPVIFGGSVRHLTRGRIVKIIVRDTSAARLTEKH